MVTIKFILLLFSIVTLGSCSFGLVEVVERDIDLIAQKADILKRKSLRLTQKNLPENIKVNEGVWLAGKAVRSKNGMPLPPFFQKKDFILAGDDPLTLKEIAGLVSEITGLRVKLEDDVFLFLEEERIDHVSGANPTSSDIDLNGYPINTDPIPSGLDDHNKLPKDFSMSISWSGKLSDFLDYVSSYFGLSWQYYDGLIRVYRFETKTFTFIPLPTSTELDSNLDAGTNNGNNGDNSLASSEATQDINTVANINIWQEIGGVVGDIVGEMGRVRLSPATGTVTVTASPSTVAKVESYIKEVNTRLRKQVALNVEIYSLSLSNSDEYGFDLSSILDNGEFSFSASGNEIPLLVDAASLSWSIVDPLSDLSGSSLVVKSLSEKGNISVVSTASLTTMNNVPAPLQISRNQGYLAEIETTTSEGSVSTALTPGSVSTGLNLHFLPRVLADEKILMQFGLNISDLEDLSAFGNGQNQIQLPTTESRGFIQQAMINSGSTLVLAGFEQSRNSINKTGFLNEDFWFFGGGKRGEKDRNVLVILITPSIVRI